MLLDKNNSYYYEPQMDDAFSPKSFSVVDIDCPCCDTCTREDRFTQAGDVASMFTHTRVNGATHTTFGEHRAHDDVFVVSNTTLLPSQRTPMEMLSGLPALRA